MTRHDNYYIATGNFEYSLDSLDRKDMAENKDISIIGGSTAGFLTACRLAEQGASVRLFEATEQFTPPPRTLIVTRYMREVLGSLGQSAVVNEIRKFELFTDGRVATISLQDPDLVIERSTLLHELAAEAESAGVEVLTGRRFQGLKSNGKRLSFSVSRNGGSVEESTDVLVGADGTFSRVAQSAGWPSPAIVHLLQAVVDLPEDQSPETTRVWFLPQETPYFFWLIPHSSTQGVLGLIGKDEEQTRQSLERFMEKKRFVPIELQDAQVPLYTEWIPNHRRIGDGHVYLVGDAAGHVKVSTVGGVVTGFRGAVGVTEAILNGGPGSTLHALRRELDRHSLIRRVLNRFTQKEYSHLIDLLTPSTRHSLSAISRDNATKLLRHVILKQPRLLLLGLRAFLSRKG